MQQKLKIKISSDGAVTDTKYFFQEKNIFSNMFKKPQKPAEGAAADKVQRFDFY